MLDPELVDSFVRVGATGFALIAVWAFATGRVLPASRVDKREEQLVAERDEWRTIANDALAKLGRLTDVLEATVGKKLE